MKVLITGGAGFVGSRLAKLYREAGAEVRVFDNLRRRGGELNLPDFKRLGIHFHHGDIRVPTDLAELPGNFDLLVEASAEPSVLAGVNSAPNYLVDTNLTGTVHCLNFARERVGATIFLSTSRVYSLEPLLALPLEKSGRRLALAKPRGLGLSERGIAEDFPVNTARSLYGATKLCSEILLQEYVHNYGMKAVINRCGVIAGAGQFGKVDQGVFTLWIANHYFGKPLRYTGFGGEGVQVRDLLHPHDLFSLLEKQGEMMDKLKGEIFNVGGGLGISTSLAEWTEHARAVTGKTVDIGSVKEQASVDIPFYVTDSAKASKAFGWEPKVSPREIAQEIAGWIGANEPAMRAIFG